ncbi:pyridoxal phosphate-dependent aminotransferase [Clostridiaceae bacterium M8S5]|nr:pyridoxal phosphate-dependent aminotransferase [Clostridiaceae bacterium M8S5]
MDLFEYVNKRKRDEYEMIGVDGSVIIANNTNISIGVSELDPPKFYTDHFIKELKNHDFIKRYTANAGHPMLTGTLKFYENTLANKFKGNKNLVENLCVTTGATPAITFFFEYFANKYINEKIMLVGLNYYLFYECMTKYKIEGITVTSTLHDRIAPTTTELIMYIEKYNPKLIVLTLPMNPSGECYSEEELREIVRIVKQKDILLLLDKCQLEEFASCYQFLNMNKVILEEDYVQNTIFINSISKTRNLPGARLGYIFANKEIIDYITYLNEIYYCIPPLTYVIPFIADLLARINYIIHDEQSRVSGMKIVNKMYKNISKLNTPKGLYRNYTKPILDSVFEVKEIDNFYKEIDNNYNITYNNYLYTKNKFKKHLHSVTELRGGFNFCIKLKNIPSKKQLDLARDIIIEKEIAILPEIFFNNNKIQNPNELFWIRITAARVEEEYRKLIDEICDFLDKNIDRYLN